MKVQAAFEIDMPPPITPWDFRTLAISADGSVLGVCNARRSCSLFDRNRGKIRPDDGLVDTAVCRSSDGTLMAGALDGGRIQWLDVASGKTGEIKSNLQSAQMVS